MSRPRKRQPRKKPNTLQLWYGKLAGFQPDLCVTWGEGIEKCDARLGVSYLGPLLDELQKRGYDPRTLHFEISKPTRPTAK